VTIATPDEQTISRLYNEQCAAEPIHIPGGIQPHGLLLVVDPRTLELVQMSAGVLRHFRRERPEDLLGVALGEVVEVAAEALRGAIETLSTGIPQPLDLPLPGCREGETYECVGHRSGPWVILEWLPVSGAQTSEIEDPHRLFNISRTLSRIRDADDVSVAETTVREVQAISGYDRVMLYRFLPDWSGEVIAECCAEGVDAKFLGLRFPSTDIPPQARRLYELNTLRVLADVEAEPDPLYPAALPDAAPLDQTHSLLRSLSPAHRIYLHNMGVRATMTVSLLHRGSLWGMIACHHGTPRTIPNETREAVRALSEMIASVVSVRITSAEASLDHREAYARAALLHQVDVALSRAKGVELLANFGEALRNAFGASAMGCRIGEFRFVSAESDFDAQPDDFLDTVHGYLAEADPAAGPLVLTSLPRAPATGDFAGLLAQRVGSVEGDFLFFARREVSKEVVWGGRPGEYDLQQDGERIVLNPRRSFAAWRQSIEGESRDWSPEDISALSQLVTAVREAHDLQENTRLAAQLRRQAERDSLTRMYNRSMLEPGITERLGHPDFGLVVVLLDLDHFKRINDTLGHPAGDALLVAVANFLRRFLSRRDDIVVRMGGDEFVLLCSVRLPFESAVVSLCQRLLDRFEREEAFEVGGIRVGLSMGVACEGLHGSDAASLLRSADMALYQAKDRGRNTYCVFDDTIGQHMSEDVRLERDLRRDLECGRLALYYQPRLRIADGSVAGVEALLRWTHDTLGPISPDRFIPLAERSGLIGAIGDWVLEEAVAAIARRRDAGLAPLVVAVNISMAQLYDRGLAQRMRELCTRYAVEPSLLEVELTETATIEDFPLTVEFLNRIREFGVSSAMDDFGTGYSSLAYLRKLPIAYVKIDRSFIVDGQSSEDEQTLLRGILGLIQGLKLTAIAEGVETTAQLDWLREHGCEQIQGYLISPAIPEADLEGLLRSIEPPERP
jgi:diguanylate cyclase (GGDEF)-like protein